MLNIRPKVAGPVIFVLTLVAMVTGKANFEGVGDSWGLPVKAIGGGRSVGGIKLGDFHGNNNDNRAVKFVLCK